MKGLLAGSLVLTVRTSRVEDKVWGKHRPDGLSTDRIGLSSDRIGLSTDRIGWRTDRMG